MPRKGPAPRRDLLPDPIYRSVLVTQIVNKVLERGKRSLAERVVYEALDLVKDRSDGDPVAVLKGRWRTPSPSLKSRAVGSVALRTRCRLRLDLAGPPPCRSAGWLVIPSSGGRRRWPRNWPPNCWMPPTGSAPLSSVARTCTRWPSPTKPSPTTAGKHPRSHSTLSKAPQICLKHPQPAPSP